MLGHARTCALAGLVSAFLAPACSQSSGPTNDHAVQIPFRVVAAGAPVSCTSASAGLGTSKSTVKMGFLRFYVSNIRLLDATGAEVPVAIDTDGAFQTDSVAMLDFEDGTGNCAQSGNAPVHTSIAGHTRSGTYTGLAFTVGIPDAQNHADPTKAKPPLDSMAMHWSWADGYRFFRLETAPDGNADGFAVHIGCSPNCQKPNRTEVRLAKFDPDHDQVTLDLGTLLSSSDLTEKGGCTAGVTDDVCKPIFGHLGIDVNTGQADPSKQDAFRAEPR